MKVDQNVIEDVVRQVLDRLGTGGIAGPVSGNGRARRHGLFTDVNEAVAAAREAFDQLSGVTLEGRKR
ncbi:MAG: aldehyde dehydrogenase EutE, partial [Pirellulaceae bacterium]|nr:aldehyde dehydrogenase EutE [Pirellulaceae bacterium]